MSYDIQNANNDVCEHNYNIENIFPTPIYSCFLENKFAVQVEIANALKNIKYDSDNHYNHLGKMFETTSTDVDIITEHRLYNLALAIDQHINQYCKELGFQPRQYQRTSWITKTSQGGHTFSHTHGSADISGCYYFQTTENDGNIFFNSPVSAAISSLCYQKSIARHEHKPMVGKLLLFPGWLEHGVKSNTENSERICLAFSIVFSR